MDPPVDSLPNKTNAEAAKLEKLGKLPVQVCLEVGCRVRDPESETESVHEACWE